MNILAIDPGAETCACAWFANDVLARVAFDLAPDGDGLGVVVVERMQADERTRGIDVRHLLACAFNGGAAAGFAAGQARAPIEHFTPTQWKGSEPKPVQHARLFGLDHAAVLSAAEREIVGGAATARAVAAAVDKGARDRWGRPGADYYARNWTMHNLLDAVALGCWFLGRLEKR